MIYYYTICILIRTLSRRSKVGKVKAESFDRLPENNSEFEMADKGYNY